MMNTSFWVEDPQENPSDPAERTELAENNRYAVACSKILLGKNGAALELEITNKAETPLTLYAKDPKVNGVPAVLDEYTESSNWDIAPGAVRVVPLLLKTGEIEPAPAELSSVEISFESAEQREAEHGSVR